MSGLWPDDSEDDYAPSPQESDADIHDDELGPPGSPVAVNLASYGGVSSEDAGREAYGSSESASFEEDEDGQLRRRRKRRRLSPDPDIPLGRLPFKRMPGAFSMEYLALLNKDVDDAKERIIAEPDHSGLPTTQLGMVTWTSTEKRLFFDALARLGKGDLPAVSSRIETKSVAEVAQYIRLLDEGSRARITKTRDAVISAEIPAAAEISPQCGLALDAAADELSLRQQRYEEKREQQRWEEFPWNMTREAAAEVEERPEERREAFANLFNVPSWLRLSDRVFMNASFAENNWRYVDEEPPSVRSTAFVDFHNLAVSVTRRIVSATLFFAASRIEAKAGADSRTRSLVKRRDVVAAVESLGMARDSGEFWARCARRLKLDVYDEEEAASDEDGFSLLSFDEVEDRLGAGERNQSPKGLSESEESTEGEDTDTTDTDVEEAEAKIEAAEAALETELKEETRDDDVRQEAQELMLYTALDIPPTHRAIQGVTRRIVAERNNEAYADACDEVASAQEEMRLWGVLRLEAPEELGKRTRGVKAGRREMASVDDVLKRGDWRAGLRYLSGWEVAPREGSG